VKRLTINWPDIIRGKVLLQTPLGTEYELSEVGRIWVSPADYREAVKRGGRVLCDLVSSSTDNASKNLWAIVRLRDPAQNHLNLSR
jgi:hypothetical protein